MLEAKEVYPFLLFVNGWFSQLFTPCSQPVLLSTSSLNTQQVREICRCNICVFTTIMTCQLGYYAQALIYHEPFMMILKLLLHFGLLIYLQKICVTHNEPFYLFYFNCIYTGSQY
jgi:hypothetical protein